MQENKKPCKYKAQSMIGSSRNKGLIARHSVNNSISEKIQERSIEEQTLEATREVHHLSAPKIDIQSIGCQADDDDDWSPLKLRNSDLQEEVEDNQKSKSVLHNDACNY